MILASRFSIRDTALRAVRSSAPPTFAFLAEAVAACWDVVPTSSWPDGEAGGAALEVLVDPARQHRDLAVAEQRPDRVGDPLEEVPVVGDHDQGAGPAVEEVLEDVEGVDVEVVGGLVEQQHVGLVEQQHQQLEAAALATGQVADPGGQLVAGEAEPLQHRGRRDLAVRGLGDPPERLDHRQHPAVGVEVVELLGQVPQRDRAAAA